MKSKLPQKWEVVLWPPKEIDRQQCLLRFILGDLAVLDKELPPLAVVFGKQLYHVYLLGLVLADVLDHLNFERAGEAAVLVDLDANLIIPL